MLTSLSSPLFRVLLVLLELLVSLDQEEDLDPRALRVPLDKEACLYVHNQQIHKHDQIKIHNNLEAC